MLHSVSWLDIVGDKELCLQKRGVWVEGGGVAQAGEPLLFRHKLKVSSLESQTVQEWSSKAPEAQPREMREKKRRQKRVGVSGGSRRGSLVKGFLRPESPRMQGKQEVGLVMCVISTL